MLTDIVKEENETREKLKSSTRQPRSKISPRSNGIQNENGAGDSTVQETRAEVHAENDNSEANTAESSSVVNAEPVTESLPTQGEFTFKVKVIIHKY